MTDKEPLDQLAERWQEEEITAKEMIDHLFGHMKDHQQLFARREVRMLNTERRFGALAERIEAFEQWMATVKKQVSTLWDRLRGRQA